MSKHRGRSHRSRESGEQLSHRRVAEKFFLSPTWNWPQFDPSCCQECGRVIPMLETGWIFNEVIVCEECHQVLDKQQTQRQQWLRQQDEAKPQTVAVAVQAPTEIKSPEVAAELPAAEPPATPPPVHPSAPPTMATKSIARDPAPMLRELLISSPMLLHHAARKLPVITTPPVTPPAVPVAAKEPTFELTSPTTFDYRTRFANVHETPEEMHTITDSRTDDLPLIDAMIPRFELTEPMTFDYRATFANVHETLEETQSLTGSIADDLPLIDAMVPRFELTEPTTFDYRATFANVHESTEPTQNIKSTNADELPLIDAMVPRFKLTEPEHVQWRIHFADGLLSLQELAGTPTDSLPFKSTPVALPLFDNMLWPELSVAASAKPKARQRNRQSQTESLGPLPPAAPLSFVHPVDQLLSDLHDKKLDAQHRQMIRRSRQRDPFFAEVDAMLAAATVLRDQWMAFKESQDQRKSSAG